jgi:hypothetical protein
MECRCLSRFNHVVVDDLNLFLLKRQRVALKHRRQLQRSRTSGSKWTKVSGQVKLPLQLQGQ